jgi:tetratricopeptide (TPR) repeat protein
VANAGQFPPTTAFRWDFGDGQSAVGSEVPHVYLALGRFPVKLSADGKTIDWPLEIYEIQHVTEEIKEGKPAEYAATAKKYDRGKLSLEALGELAHLASEAGEAKTAIEVGKQFLARSTSAAPVQVRKIRRLMAECAIQLGEGGLDEAIANYGAAIGDDAPADEKLAVLARLVRLVGIERGQPEKAGDALKQADEVWKKARLDEKTADAYRDCLIAAGDVLLWNAKIEGAREHYRRAEALDKVLIPPQVRAAKIGSYPNTIREFIQSGDVGAALDVVARWEHTFPTEKLNGQPLYWHGRILALRGQHRDAARHLARAIALSVGAAYESEARWLLAESLDEIGKREEAKRELARLLAAGFDDQFAKKAREKLTAELGKKGK